MLIAGWKLEIRKRRQTGVDFDSIFQFPFSSDASDESTGSLEFFPQFRGLLEFALEFAVTQMAFHERDFFN